MYFPYVRGRQFELIALRELLEKGLLHPAVVPIVEPVKLSSTLTGTMAKFIEAGKALAVIHNPKVGSFGLETEKTSHLKDVYEAHLQRDIIVKAHIAGSRSEDELAELGDPGADRSAMLTIVTDRDCLPLYERLFGAGGGRYNLISADRTIRRTITSNKVLFEDKFNKLEKNADYKDKDELFSDDHLFYSEEGYVGFSDFSIAGSDYSEWGFAPYAVAIHIVYFDPELNLRVIHFVSDSNDDIQDPAGKFYEAVGKLVQWSRENPVRTYGLNELIAHHRNETYPGLGTVKKLAIMHHLELMGRYLGGGTVR
ncbi:sce7725 family protein [Cohnella fermenti]|uniref:Sce7725 family protein n=1 Tax=Cohnella fermenti TaxID=2565925 RepID=A0A4S4CA05_9BACL|nr:sce7725 family protein [Cohnella fermenti]THF82660.1 sce7725 family protein [Cohnella fermenti]